MSWSLNRRDVMMGKQARGKRREESGGAGGMQWKGRKGTTWDNTRLSHFLPLIPYTIHQSRHTHQATLPFLVYSPTLTREPTHVVAFDTRVKQLHRQRFEWRFDSLKAKGKRGLGRAQTARPLLGQGPVIIHSTQFRPIIASHPPNPRLPCRACAFGEGGQPSSDEPLHTT